MLRNLTIDAFVRTSDAHQALNLFADHRRMARCKVSVYQGGIDAAAARYAGTVTPSLIILEDDQPDHLDRLAEVCDPATKVVVVGAINDIHHYRALMAKGVADYLLCPLVPDQIVDALDRLYSDPAAPLHGKVVSFWGARGGTGSSCLAQNVAWLIGEHLQEPVVYLDCDLSFGSSQLALGLDAHQTLADVVAHTERLDQVLVDRSLNPCGPNMRVLASPGDLRPRPAVTVEAVDMLVDIVRRMAPVVVLDLPHVWTDWTERLLRFSTDVVMTAWPDFSSLKNAKSYIEIEEAPLQLVLNGIDAHKRTQLSAKDFEDNLGMKPVLSLPFEPGLFGDASNAGRIAAEMSPSHKAVKLMAGLSQSLSGKAARPSGGKAGFNVFEWMKA